MKQFIAKFESQIQGVLSGFDRVVFRGSLRRLTHPAGMKMYLIRNGLLCKEYLDHVKKVSQELKDASLEPYRQLHLPIEFINNPKADKDQIARAHAAKLDHRSLIIYTIIISSILYFQRNTTGAALISSKY